MRSFIKSPTLLMIALLPVILMGCTNKYDEEAPFFDGLSLEYGVGAQRVIYSVHALENKKFKMVRAEKREPLSDNVEELYIKTNGQVYKSTYKGFEGKFSPIWLPIVKMKVGDTFDGGKLVERKDKWGRWNVLVVQETSVGVTHYYDLATGFLVGEEASTLRGNSKVVLINTNANISGLEKESSEEGKKPDGDNK